MYIYGYAHMYIPDYVHGRSLLYYLGVGVGPALL